MKHCLCTLLVTLAMALTDASRAHARPLVLAHYMPWFRSKPVSGAWGFHWTFDKYDPDKIDASGRRQIAAHLYPLIGPYDSADPDLVECHVLLMKLAGIDGVIADWYGNDQRNDYAPINAATLLLFREIEKRGLHIAIAYEDRIFENVERPKAIGLAREAFAYADKQFFHSPAYVCLDSRPVVLLFGPAFFKGDAEWDAVLAGSGKRPRTFALHPGGPGDAGNFAWPPMHLVENGVLTTEKLLNNFAQCGSGNAIPAAVVGFHDIYAEAGMHASYGRLDARDGRTFEETLDLALKSNQPLVQLVTWNDFGEGTAMEPTREFGTRFLQSVHERRTGTPLDAEAVDDALSVYALRKSAGGRAIRGELDRVVGLLHAGKTVAATAGLRKLQSAAPSAAK